MARKTKKKYYYRRLKKREQIINRLRSAMYRAGFKDIRLIGTVLRGKIDKWDAPIKLLQYLDKHYKLLGGYGSHSGYPTYIRYKGETENLVYRAFNNREREIAIHFKI